jgi:protein-S-isoprenylcysteine O-methyltransferase Ste14
MVIKLVIFLVFTAANIYLSRRCLSRRECHGFYRFFAWEAIVALLLLNVDHWFEDKFVFRQLVSWTLLFISAWMIAESIILIIAGKPKHTRQDDVLFKFEKTTQLVTRRIYRFIRHPMYSSLIFLTWGACLKDLTLISIALAVIATVFLVLSALREETENIRYFGDEYTEYMKRSKRFIPFVC